MDGWINVYEKCNDTGARMLFRTREEADAWAVRVPARRTGCYRMVSTEKELDQPEPPTHVPAWVVVVVAALAVLGLMTAIAFAVEGEQFHWKSCQIIDGTVSACGPGETGTEAEMYKAEKQSRKKHDLFLREWTQDGDTALQWPPSHVWLLNQGKKK